MSGCTVEERRAVFLARDLADGEVGICGVGAALPFAAMRLAQETHAPDLVIALEGPVNPRPAALGESPTDPRLYAGAEAVTDLQDLFAASERGLDFWFMSGIQTDRTGDLNLHRLGGTPERPAFRGPGVGNVSLAATCRRWYNVPGAHVPRAFAERVDFVSALGRRCRYVVTPLAVLDLPDGRLRLRHTMPGIAVEEVLAATGCGLDVAPDVTETPAPTADELDVLRRVVDPTGLLR